MCASSAYFTARTVKHDVCRLDISVDDSPRVHEVQRLLARRRHAWNTISRRGDTHPQELKEVVFDLHLGQRAVKLLPVRVRYILHDEAVRARRAIMDGVHKADDVRAPSEIAQNLDLALYLLLCDGFQHLDDA